MSETVDTSFMGQPTGTEDASLGDNRIRSFKLAWKERMEKEHNMDLDEAGSQPRQGLHKAGSAVSFYQASAPTTRNGISLSSSDAGLSWIDSDTDDLYIWNGTNWVHVGGPGSTSDYRFQGKIERITSGSGNWTVPAGVYRIRVTCIGGGGGGGGGYSGTNGGNGTQTTFAGATTGLPGGGGALGGTGVARGGAPAGGNAGSGGGPSSANSGYFAFGGSGGGAGGYSAQGTTATSGSFGGGGGGGQSGGVTGAGGGGGGGTNISMAIGDIIDVTPGSTKAYSVGGGGTGGAAGASSYPGGAGGSGIIIIEY